MAQPSATSFAKGLIAISGLNLALSYENAAIDRLQRRVSECIVPEIKEKIKHHLAQTKEAAGAFTRKNNGVRRRDYI